jgi:hypothetical protein
MTMGLERGLQFLAIEDLNIKYTVHKMIKRTITSILILTFIAIRCSLILSILTLLPLSAAEPTDYYVRRDGNDSNDGLTDSSGGAKLTIQAGYNLLSAGDTLNVNGDNVGDGTYAEDLVLDNGDASAGNFKKIVGFNGTVTLAGQGTGYNIEIEDDYTWIENLLIDANADGGDTNQHCIRVGGGVGEIIGTVITNNILRDGLYGVRAYGTVGAIAHGGTISGNTFTNNQNHVMIYGKAGGDGWLVESNMMWRLREWDTVSNDDADTFKLISGDNHRLIGNYSSGSESTNDVPVAIDRYHIDAIQTFDQSNQAPLKDVEIAYNIFEGHHTGWQFTTVLGNGAGVDCVFHHNVIANPSAINWEVPVRPYGNSPFSMSDAAGTITFTNNTLYLAHNMGTWVDFAGLVHKNNLYLEVEQDGGSDERGYIIQGTTPTANNDYNLTYSGISPDAGGNDVNSDPTVLDKTDALGPDNIPWTTDDGFNLIIGSPAFGAGEGGVTIGAYDFSALHPVKRLRIHSRPLIFK